jgi:hypothetical protein
MGVTIRIDSHKSSLAAAVLDEMGRAVGVREFRNDERGFETFLQWVRTQSDDRAIGIEGAGSAELRRGTGPAPAGCRRDRLRGTRVPHTSRAQTQPLQG